MIVGDDIAKYRLCVLRQALRMEKCGFKSSGGAIRPRIAKEFGLKPRDSYDKYFARIEEMLK